MRRSRQARKREFSAEARREILERDMGECIFCKKAYHLGKGTMFSMSGKQIMHYIPRSQGGLGVAKNGAVGCIYHHTMLDNGNEGRREEMLAIFREYLKSRYEDWNEKELIYSKWND